MSFFIRFKNVFSETKKNLEFVFAKLFRSGIEIDFFEELENQLIIADLDVHVAKKIIHELVLYSNNSNCRDSIELLNRLRKIMADILINVEKPLRILDKFPFVILVVGVNGVGKTTTIGKLAYKYKVNCKNVMLAAGDTFRAAAIEQLKELGDSIHVPVISQKVGADPASVIFDAVQSARSRNIDILIADTAGRLQNKLHLMEEIKKIIRVIKKLNPEYPHEIMLILDASIGQNSVIQANIFNNEIGITGITLTKLDGTARGGVIFSISDKIGIPIRYIGVGERMKDLQLFESRTFIDALLPKKVSLKI